MFFVVANNIFMDSFDSKMLILLGHLPFLPYFWATNLDDVLLA
jgi:hypothetical protein